MTFSDDIRRKADEAHLPEKAKHLGDAVADVVQALVGMVGGFAAEKRDTVDGALDQAQHKVDENVSGKHAEKVTKVRAQVDRGLDKLVEQSDKSARPAAAGGGDVGSRPDAAWPSTPVPDDMHSAFDDDRDDDAGPRTDGPVGSPS